MSASSLTDGVVEKRESSLGDAGPCKDLEKVRSVKSISSDLDPEAPASKNIPSDVCIDFDIVDWDGADDPENPLNWTNRRKFIACALASLMTIITPLASSIFAPGVPLLMHDFQSDSKTLASFVVSVYLMGFTLGPLVVAPASEIWGRLPVYHTANIVFFAFTIGCALSTDITMFCIFRFFMGAAGSSPLTNGGATIADVISVEKRGAVMAVWAMGPLMGPVLGPIIGGFISASGGWRWTFWFVAISSGILLLIGLIFLRETYAPAILHRKALRLRKATGNTALRSKLDQDIPQKEFFRRALVRPLKFLFRSPIVILLGLNVSLVFSYLYLLFTTFTYVFEVRYHFTTSESGLSFLGIGVGMFLGLPLFGKTSDKYLKRRTAANNGQSKPEFRLPPLVLGPWLIASGLFGYGWTAEKHVHWIAPILLTIPIGLGIIATFMPTQTYLIDAFGRYSASAIAATTLLRSLFGALIPLAGQPLYARLGLGWGNSLLAFIALAMAPVPWVFLKYGERIRTSRKFALEL